jgi:hypothetical protein
VAPALPGQRRRSTTSTRASSSLRLKGLTT